MQRAELVDAIAGHASDLLAELRALRAESQALRRELDAWAPSRCAALEQADSDRPTVPVPVREMETMPAAAA
jgi:hypothetical protein